MLSPQWLDQLRTRITLSALISRSGVRLLRAGREQKACCPFHSEKSPSFTVNDEKGFYHCFGCGAHGDAIRWMTDHQGLSFMDAVKELAAEAGLDVPAPDPRMAKAAEKRDSLHDVMAEAQGWFVHNLTAPGGEGAQAYLASRGFDAATVQRFGFGYAPEDRQALKGALSRFPEPMLIEAGLRIVVEDRDPYDRFRGRLMLPIQDARGRVIAFGGRILAKDKTPKDSGAPKYLNSPDTPLFDKGRTLYNLHRAAPAARETGRLVVVEGYMDVIALAAAGIAEAVAPLGTALTEQQIEMLWRHIETPVLCFDGDAAGQRAAMRAITRALPLLRPAHSLRIVRLPQGLDPDDLIKAQGPAAMRAVLDEARSLIDVLWETERDAVPLVTPEDKAGLKARLMAHVEAIAHPDIASLYRRELTDRFSAFAFPKRDSGWSNQSQPRGRPGRNGRFGQPAPAPSSPESLERLRRASSGGARDSLAAAVIAGLLRWPAQIAQHAEMLARAPSLDPRLALLVDSVDAGEPLESEHLATILAANGLEVPGPAAYSGLRFGFLGPDATLEQDGPDLASAILILVERPMLEAALKAATDRHIHEFTEESFAEQQRLRERMLEFDARLRHMAARHAASS
ncbi:DNA primase [Novosphingobium colocasiae]|uniref:DNA primase n=1 Tax=Novosphingobium colocasiae TaxID=1256513 RepID=A0A918PEH2_9SPHN|nr:DNA primase [Novosphingobium colocasiae]GGZ01162.1 DNA primase [Novosphingobium colocasiae]